MRKLIWLTAVFGTLSLVSCDKSTDINIVTPKEGESFDLGAIVEVRAKLYDPDILGGVDLTATAETGDTIYYERQQIRGGQSYMLLKRFALTRQGICIIKVDAWGGYGGSKSVTVNVN